MWRCACALALLCALLAHCDTYKRAEMATVPFVLGSRYGRSSPRMMTPRNDRFFMGSRYGKRSEPAPTEQRDVTWRLCDIPVFAPLCSLRQLPSPKDLYDRIDQQSAEKIYFED